MCILLCAFVIRRHKTDMIILPFIITVQLEYIGGECWQKAILSCRATRYLGVVFLKPQVLGASRHSVVSFCCFASIVKASSIHILKLFFASDLLNYFPMLPRALVRLFFSFWIFFKFFFPNTGLGFIFTFVLNFILNRIVSYPKTRPTV